MTVVAILYALALVAGIGYGLIAGRRRENKFKGGAHTMSRKAIAVFVAVVGAILGVVASEMGLSIDPAALATGLAAVLLWVFYEAKADIAKVGAQIGRFKDPKFLLTIVNAIVAALGTGEVIPPALAESIIAVLALIVGVLFKTDPRLAKT